MKMDKNTLNSCRVDILRHGECEGGNIFRGLTDVALSAKGQEQMRISSAGRKWDQILSSPLKRCQAFAENLSYQQRIPLLVEDNLREMSFGDWDGKLVDDVLRDDAERIKAWRENPVDHSPPQGEPLTHVALRARNLLEHLQKNYLNQQCLLVTHGGFIRVLLCQVLDAPLQSAHSWQIPFAGLVSLFGFQLGEQWRWQIDLQHQAQAPAQ